MGPLKRADRLFTRGGAKKTFLYRLTLSKRGAEYWKREGLRHKLALYRDCSSIWFCCSALFS